MKADNVTTLAQIEFFSVGGCGYAGGISKGEKAFHEIYVQKNNLEQFVKLYGLGGNPAKMYALAAFYKLDPLLYNHIKQNYKNQEIEVQRMDGCDMGLDDLSLLIKNLESGYYDRLFTTNSK